MEMSDDALSSVIHHLASIIEKLRKSGLNNLAMKLEEVRQELLRAINED